MELLAPAGNPESFKAALESGADAIYLGLPWFNARRPAKNFTPDSLKESLDLAKERGVRVFVTINTDIKTSEIEDATKVLKLISTLGVDAVIIKDLGLFYIAKTQFPNLELHLSTQFGISNSYGAREAKILGAKRVIPARELSFKELGALQSSPDDIPEVETFVQGSMCFSFSGKCLLSSWVGGKSANRGVCQAPCRLKYSHDSDNSPFFSMKDLNLVSQLDSLREVNSASLKIEGRLKSPGWVGNITSIYSKALKGDFQESKDALMKYSGREMGEGFTTGLDNLTAKHTTRFGKLLGRVVDIVEDDNKSFAKLDFTSKDSNTSLRFVREDGEFITIVHPDNCNLRIQGDFSFIENVGKLEKGASVYEVIPSRSSSNGLGKFRYDIELTEREGEIEIKLFTDSGIYIEVEKHKKVVKSNRGVYPDAVVDKLENKVVNGWRFNSLYSEDILMAKTTANQIVKRISYILAVTIPESNPLKIIELDRSIQDFIGPNPEGEESKEVSFRRILFKEHSGVKFKNVIVDEIEEDYSALDSLVKFSQGKTVIISLFPIMFEDDILRVKGIVEYLEARAAFEYEINDISQYNLLVRELGIDSNRVVGGQGLACYNHISIRFLKDVLGISRVAIPLEMDSRGIIAMVDENRGYGNLIFTKLSRVPGMYSRAQAKEFYEGAEFKDKIGTVMKIHKYQGINIFYIEEYYSSKEAKDLENLSFYGSVKEEYCLENPGNCKSFNLERRLY
jgi:collagenase-like PrtC family protease